MDSVNMNSIMLEIKDMLECLSMRSFWKTIFVAKPNWYAYKYINRFTRRAAVHDVKVDSIYLDIYFCIFISAFEAFQFDNQTFSQYRNRIGLRKKTDVGMHRQSGTQPTHSIIYTLFC